MTSMRDEGSSDERSAKADQPTKASDLRGNLLTARWRNRVLLSVIIVLAGLWVYSPSYHGEWLWDDDVLLVENPTVQHRVSLDAKVPTDSRATLVKLWLKPGTPDYFPLP